MSDSGLAAVIFDVDGTLVDSEQSGHRPCFNDAFAAFGLTDHWDATTYRELLKVTGGERRIAMWFDDPRSSQWGEPLHIRAQLARFIHARKTDDFAGRCETGSIPVRPGVIELLNELRDFDITVGIASTGSRRWVKPLLVSTFGLDRFACVITGDDVFDRKPAPDAYVEALRSLGIEAHQALAIEDSAPGLAAARNAGIPCIVVANEDTDVPAISPAHLAVTRFGAGSDVMEVIYDPYCVASNVPRLTVPVLRQLHDAANS